MMSLLEYFIAIPPKNCNFIEFSIYYLYDCTFISLYLKVVTVYARKMITRWKC